MSEVNPTVEYRPIPGFAGYLVGDDGSVWSCWKSSGGRVGKVNSGIPQRQLKTRTVKPTERYPRNKPYEIVGLRSGGRTYNMTIHRLVLMAFVGPCPEGMECRHLDGDVSNNHRSNLKWGTKQENWDDKRHHGTATMGETGTSKLTNEQVLEIRRLHRAGWPYQELMRRFNIGFGAIAAVVQRRTWLHLSQEQEGEPSPDEIWQGEIDYAVGERHGQAVLTADQVLEMRKVRAETHAPYSKLAARYGVSMGTVAAIVKRRSWRHI